jgi:hypothetical protein
VRIRVRSVKQLSGFVSLLVDVALLSPMLAVPQRRR